MSTKMKAPAKIIITIHPNGSITVEKTVTTVSGQIITKAEI